MATNQKATKMQAIITSHQLTYVSFAAFCTSEKYMNHYSIPEIGGWGRDTYKTSNKNTIAYYCFLSPKNFFTNTKQQNAGGTFVLHTCLYICTEATFHNYFSRRLFN